MVLMPDALLLAILAIFLFFALCGALVLVVISMGRPRTLPLVVAGLLVLLSLILVALSPVNLSPLLGVILAVLGVAVAVLGGNPVARRILDIASGGRVQETSDGGIVLPAAGAEADAAPGAPTRTLMRGGTVIGYLERIAVVMGIISGYPEAIAVVVAVKGIGRFSELATPEARERFIVGTLASLVWACVVGAMVRLAIF